ncbi:MAG: hypothetical protein ACI30M_03495 [Muribaculaceae bacterium]
MSALTCGASATVTGSTVSAKASGVCSALITKMFGLGCRVGSSDLSNGASVSSTRSLRSTPPTRL